jgi:hypothetical protein
MKEIIIFVAAGVAALATFGIIAKKYGSNCTP